MRNVRKRKTPVTATEKRPTLVVGNSKPQTTRTLIRRFHVLLKKQRQLQQSVSDAKELREVEQEIEQLGGLAAYQRMSSIGQGTDRGGGSEKILISWLVGLGSSKRDGKSLSLLEVGALEPDNYASCASWMTTTPIDLRSRHPSILEQDFLTMDVDEHGGRWDVVSLSLVINFVPEPRERGRMLVQAYKFLRPSGLLFLALPLPCVANSRYMSFDHLELLMRAIGFVEVERKWRQGGKMAYWLYSKTPADAEIQTDAGFRTKRVCREGPRNNFCILLD